MSEKLDVIPGDITKLKVDAIVNAANNSLLGGGGVDGAIHRAAGPELLEECRKLNGCATGQAKITKGFCLPAAWIIHTVGPVWRGGIQNEDVLLAECYRNSLRLAVEFSFSTLAFPSIGTGTYRFPLERAANIAIGEIVRFLETAPTIAKVSMVCFDEDTYQAYFQALQRKLNQ